MILELDAGNTRIKWRVRQQLKGSDEWTTHAEGSVFAQQKAPSVFIELGKQLEKLPVEEIKRLLVASVRGDGFRSVFSALMTEKWHLHPEYAQGSASFGALHNGYEDPARLGVDRWLALAAACQQVRTGCVVVDCGTTLTVDFVDEDGQHKGGYIVPGLHLMREALTNRSKALATGEHAWTSSMPGRSTAAAIHNGILAMATGFLRDVQRQQADKPVMWFLTGGDAPMVAAQLDWECKVCPDLVLDGLELVMLGSGQGH